MNSYIYPGLKRLDRYGIGEDGEMIIRYTCEYYGVPRKEVVDHCRKREFVEARRMIYFLMRTITQLSLSRIARYFHRDHTSVLRGIDSFNDLRSVYPELNRDMALIKERLYSIRPI